MINDQSTFDLIQNATTVVHTARPSGLAVSPCTFTQERELLAYVAEYSAGLYFYLNRYCIIPSLPTADNQIVMQTSKNNFKPSSILLYIAICVPFLVH